MSGVYFLAGMAFYGLLMAAVNWWEDRRKRPSISTLGTTGLRQYDGLLVPDWHPDNFGYKPDEFDALATYNAECSRGIVHTPEYHAKMEEERERFNDKQRERLRAEGAKEVSPGCWITPPRSADA